jgi:hypothetical protein
MKCNDDDFRKIARAIVSYLKGERSICNYFDGGVCCHNEHGGEVGEVTENYCEKCSYWRGDNDKNNKEV